MFSICIMDLMLHVPLQNSLVNVERLNLTVHVHHTKNVFFSTYSLMYYLIKTGAKLEKEMFSDSDE